MPKPAPGFENRYVQIYNLLTGKEKEQTVGFWDKIKGKKPLSKEELLKEWNDNSIPSYETIRAPRVGRDKAADDWALEQYENSDKAVSPQKFLEENEGYYVIDLAPELAGVPVYMTPLQDRNVFRGKFLEDCQDLLGKQLFESAWETKLAPESLVYGKAIMAVADKYAAAHNLQYLKEQRAPPEEMKTMESRVHILYAAAHWLIFYAERGHGYEADY